MGLRALEGQPPAAFALPQTPDPSSPFPSPLTSVPSFSSHPRCVTAGLPLAASPC
ncbi:hypothetical protein FA10DRAFT_268650 [Acaromyces ingoldii]|uniref:Uncharacterized protein n=1 Tax=Acaromyces ingoldii TaxID=215250 RepID=A0A316YL56_9BASI|nr:hypothetical protein FA10DRAFT_268650 [Acaromyces ingoldii]PWN88455.1 hypothetical protein FA10DRAFT_268650 [Acaromyces ingoldii]